MRRIPKTQRKLPMKKASEPDFYDLMATSPLPPLEETSGDLPGLPNVSPAPVPSYLVQSSLQHTQIVSPPNCGTGAGVSPLSPRALSTMTQTGPLDLHDVFADYGDQIKSMSQLSASNGGVQQSHYCPNQTPFDVSYEGPNTMPHAPTGDTTESLMALQYQNQHTHHQQPQHQHFHHQQYPIHRQLAMHQPSHQESMHRIQHVQQVNFNTCLDFGGTNDQQDLSLWAVRAQQYF